MLNVKEKELNFQIFKNIGKFVKNILRKKRKLENYEFFVNKKKNTKIMK